MGGRGPRAGAPAGGGWGAAGGGGGGGAPAARDWTAARSGAAVRFSIVLPYRAGALAESSGSSADQHDSIISARPTKLESFGTPSARRSLRNWRHRPAPLDCSLIHYCRTRSSARSYEHLHPARPD